MHFGAAVFDGDGTCYLDRLVQAAPIPSVHVGLDGALVFDTFFGVVDECAEGAFLFFGEGVGIDLVHFFAHDARGVFEHMNEGERFAVEVGNKMLRTFGQREDGSQVNQFGDNTLCIGEFLAQ